MRNATAAFLILALGATLVGCGDDDDDGGGGDTDAGSTTTDAGPVADAGNIETDAGAVSDQCTGSADQAAIMRTDYGDTMDQTIVDVAADCGTGCAFAGMMGDALEACTTECVRMDTEDAVSEGCAGCYALSVRCSADNCLNAPGNCLTAPDDVACTDCRCGRTGPMVNCVAVFEACAGVPTTTCSDD